IFFERVVRRVSQSNYRADPNYPGVVRAVNEILRRRRRAGRGLRSDGAACSSRRRGPAVVARAVPGTRHSLQPLQGRAHPAVSSPSCSGPRAQALACRVSAPGARPPVLKVRAPPARGLLLRSLHPAQRGGRRVRLEYRVVSPRGPSAPTPPPFLHKPRYSSLTPAPLPAGSAIFSRAGTRRS